MPPFVVVVAATAVVVFLVPPLDMLKWSFFSLSRFLVLRLTALLLVTASQMSRQHKTFWGRFACMASISIIEFIESQGESFVFSLFMFIRETYEARDIVGVPQWICSESDREEILCAAAAAKLPMAGRPRLAPLKLDIQYR